MACEICKKPYVPPTDEQSFDSNEKPHVCNVCGKSFSLKIQLKRHVLSHEGDVPYICNNCEKHLEQSSYNLRLYKKSDDFTCETCSKSFSSKRLLLKHASEHTSDSAFNCDECGEGFKNITALRKHAVVHKAKKGPLKRGPKKEASRGPKKEASRFPYVCDKCDKKFPQLKQLEKHQLTHKFQCDRCHNDFTSNNCLEEHQASGSCEPENNISLNSADNSNSDGKKHVCSICNKSFTRKSALEGHMVSHFVDGHESTIDDSDVDADYQTNTKLPNPIKLEPSQRQCLPKLKIRRSYPCEKCDVFCASKATYEKHMKSHETPPEEQKKIRRTFMCEYCDIVCASKTTYEKHIKSHESIPEQSKNYTCRVCNESFDTKENYKKHKLSHESTGADQSSAEKRTYKCQLCHNVFNKKRHLRKHLKCHFNMDPNETSSVSSEDIIVGKKPRRTKNLACSFCGKPFAGETCLKKHEAKHKDGTYVPPIKREKKDKIKEKLICEICDADFTNRRPYFTKHKLSHTPEVCGICDARFVDRASLREHCRIHIGTEEGRRFIECSQKALDAKNGVVQPEPKVEYIYLVLR